jgi:sugar lactone lactonase YvrE
MMSSTGCQPVHSANHRLAARGTADETWKVLMKPTGVTLLAIVIVMFVAVERVQAHPASGIVVDRKGHVYFSDLETVWKIDTQGKLTVFRAGVSGRHVHELAIDEQDNIYGADISYEPSTKKWPTDVWQMTPEGKLTYLLEPTTNPPRGMSIWRDRAGNMYFVDQNNHLKQQTLLLRRTPDGNVTTFAGSAYGHADGQGPQARFSSVGGMAFGADGSLYLTDGTSVRRVGADGNVTTIARDLNFRTPADKPTLFGGAYGNLAGLTADANGNVYVADAGNRRLLKINRDGKVEVVLRTDPPYFPNGVFATTTNDLYVLEVGFTLPNISSGPRVRKITADGKNVVITVVGAEGDPQNVKPAVVERVGVKLESAAGFFVNAGPRQYSIIALSAGILVVAGFVWQRRRRRQRQV